MFQTEDQQKSEILKQEGNNLFNNQVNYKSEISRSHKKV